MAPSFEKRALQALAKIPRGKVTTYKGLARLAGNPRAARAAGNAAHRNPHPVQVPCHRVVKSDGSLGGYAHGPKRKAALLKKEGIPVVRGKINLKRYGWNIG